MVIHQTFGNLKWLRKGRKLLAGALAVLSSSPVVARTVTVASCDRETGATVLAISAAEAGDGTKALVAAWSPYDVGNVATNARETAYVGAVAVADEFRPFEEVTIIDISLEFFLRDEIIVYSIDFLISNWTRGHRNRIGEVDTMFLHDLMTDCAFTNA